jgi:hypothetical protein
MRCHVVFDSEHSLHWWKRHPCTSTVRRQLTDWREQVTTWRDLRGLSYSHSDIVFINPIELYWIATINDYFNTGCVTFRSPSTTLFARQRTCGVTCWIWRFVPWAHVCVRSNSDLYEHLLQSVPCRDNRCHVITIRHQGNPPSYPPTSFQFYRPSTVLLCYNECSRTDYFCSL